MLTAEIIGVGDELLYGETVDTNTADIARSLQAYSVCVQRTLRVADDLEVLASEVRAAWEKARLVVLSGGLGPTPDDITREAIAAALGEEMQLDQRILQGLEAIFAGRGWKMPEANHKQAMKIPSAVWLDNPRGTAPGWWIHQEAQNGHPARDLICLPGPPAEWKPMWAEVLPKIGLPAEPYKQITFKTFGLGESRIVELLGNLFKRSGNVEVGTYAKMDGVHIVVRGEPGGVEQLARQIKPLIAEALWGEGDESLPSVVNRELASKSASLAAGESVTGGMLGQLVTSVAGASQVFLGSVVTYNATRKAELMRLDQVIEQHGCVSAEVAECMAAYAQGFFGSTYALAVTGVAGPAELEGKPVGTLYVGLVGPSGVKSKHYRLPGANPEVLRQRATYAALSFLASELRGVS